MDNFGNSQFLGKKSLFVDNFGNMPKLRSMRPMINLFQKEIQNLHVLIERKHNMMVK